MIKNLFTIIKGNNYIIADEITDFDLLGFFILMIFNYFRGMIKFKKNHVFLGSNSKIKKIKRIRSGKWLNIGDYVYIDALSREGIVFGHTVSIGKYTCIECTGSFTYLGKGLKVGDNVGLGTHCFYGCAGGITIGNDVIVGNYVSMHSENHNFMNSTQKIRLQGVNHTGIIIGNDCWIGAKVTILDGSVIGNRSVVAAGAVVNGIFPDNVVIGGIPAKILKNI